ncbi:MAG: YqaA family protein [Pseudomonadota bacterium]
MAYFGIFLSAFLAATILPFYSEFAVVAGIKAGLAPFAVWLSASVGNTLGAVVNGILGRVLGSEKAQSLMRIKPDTMQRVRSWFSRWGVWTLLLAWLPFGGDALTVVAGVMRVSWPVFVVLVFIGKAARYAILVIAL